MNEHVIQYGITIGCGRNHKRGDMNPYRWLTDEQYQWCLQAEKEWAIRLPGIVKQSRKMIEQWRQEQEFLERWTLCDW